MSPSKTWKDGVGKRIMNARVRAKLSYEEMASSCDVSVMTVRRWEDGTNAPKAGELAAISKATGNTSVDWLLFGVDHADARQPNNEPIYRGEWRDEPSLERDLAAALVRRANVRADPAEVDVTPLLEEGARELARWFAALDEYARDVATVVGGYGAATRAAMRLAAPAALKNATLDELSAARDDVLAIRELEPVIGRLLDRALPASRLLPKLSAELATRRV